MTKNSQPILARDHFGMKVKYKFNPDTLTYEKIDMKKKRSNKFLQFVIIIAIAYFLFGYLAVIFNLFEKTIYLSVSAFIGSFASVAGLLSFSMKRIQKQDIEEIGIEYFKQVVDAAEKLKQKERDLIDKEKILNDKENEISKLEIKKIEIEYLIKKASMSLFIKDQLNRIENRIVEITVENKELSTLLEQRTKISKQLIELGEEINSHENSELINEIIEMSKTSELDFEDNRPFIKNSSWFEKLIDAFVKILLK
jgi:hypothetical protein